MQNSFSAICLTVFLAGCGMDTTHRSATGGLGGVGVGALVGGPVGAAVGGVAGGVGGAMLPEGSKKTKTAKSPAYQTTRITTDTETIMHAQKTLQKINLYDGPIDGRNGAKTRSAVMAYQKQKGLRPTGNLNEVTLKSLIGQ
jgi:peptidoglycan hydrolase-like protein with peptidoglycan-binding domain